MDGTSGTGFGNGVCRDTADMGGMISPTLDPSERKAMTPAVSELQFVFTVNPRPWGKRE